LVQLFESRNKAKQTFARLLKIRFADFTGKDDVSQPILMPTTSRVLGTRTFCQPDCVTILRTAPGHFNLGRWRL